MVGTTVASGEPNIHFPSNLFEFEPIEIGLTEYPIQIYEIFNGGDVACDIEIDSSEADLLNKENFNQTILKCLTDTNISIPPGSLFETKWSFSPIEAKTYMVNSIIDQKNLNFYFKICCIIRLISNSKSTIKKQVWLLLNVLAMTRNSSRMLL